MFFRFYFLKENNIFVSSFAGEKLCKCNEKKAEQINELIPMVQWYHHRVFVKVEPLQCHPQILIWNLKRTLQSLPNLLPLWLGWMWYLKMMPLVINQWEMVEVFHDIIVFFCCWKDCRKCYFFFYKNACFSLGVPRRDTIKESITLTMSRLISWSEQIASGMVYLSSKKVVHGDLACR